MDRRLKERLIGATILVVLIVLIVPELLSGPKRTPPVPEAAADSAEVVRNVIVDLATNKATPGTDENAPASAADAAHSTAGDAGGVGGAAGAGDMAAESGAKGAGGRPASGTAPTISTLQAQQPAGAAVQGRGAPHEPSLPHDSPLPDGSHAGWAVQAGSFETRDNAAKLERELRAQGFSAVLSSSGTGKTLKYRVRIGALADRGAADRMLARLKKAGHKGTVVAL